MISEGSDSTRAIEFLAWLEVNKKRLAVVAVTIGVVISVIAVVRWRGIEAERAATVELLTLQLTDAETRASGGPAASDFQGVATRYSGTRAGARAQLLFAEALFREGHYAEARAEFERAAGWLRDESLLALAAYGVAASLDASGRAQEALNAYQEVTLRYPGSAVAGQARLGIAGLQEATGDLAQALRSYNEMTNLVSSSGRVEALLRREELLARHPELAPTNAPPSIEPIESPAGS
jgi:tetratricopeptide (TPR) repeat protein